MPKAEEAMVAGAHLNARAVPTDRCRQRRALMDIVGRMRCGAALVVGKDEKLPATDGLASSPAGSGVYWTLG